MPTPAGANDAVDAIDSAIGHLHKVRRELLSEIREADDATLARADALLSRTREDNYPEEA